VPRLLVCLVASSFAAPSLAQQSSALDDAGECAALPSCTEDRDCVDLRPGADCQDDACVIDEVDVACCDIDTPCPDELRCLPFRSLPTSTGVCSTSEFDYCRPEGDVSPTRTTVRACHTGLDGAFPVPYPIGDCDGDGFSNELELEAGGDVCAVEAALPEEGSTPGDVRCGDPLPRCSNANGACVATTGEVGECTPVKRGAVCAPLRAGPFCCTTDRFVCPNDRGVCLLLDEDVGLCAPLDFACDGAVDLARCFRDPVSGAFPVAFALGDCDGDRLRNASDERPCVADGQPDAGVVDPPRDAGGVEPDDAGPPPADAGSGPPALDGGPPTPPGPTLSFGGGGGCAVGGPPGGACLALVLLLGVLRRRHSM
jgi:hypothetical protein